jgi:hypothetical protein
MAHRGGMYAYQQHLNQRALGRGPEYRGFSIVVSGHDLLTRFQRHFFRTHSLFGSHIEPNGRMKGLGTTK